MELYSMPQLDKTSPVYSGAQYEGGGEDIATRRTSSSDVKKYGTVPSDTLPLLTSSAWSAVIHRPADEDSEPDDLPSTVDMDAIKGSPATTLNAPKTQLNTVDSGWTQEKEEDDKLEATKDAEDAGASDTEDSEGDESDSQDSDGDGDSGDSETANGSVSDSEGSESGSCSWSDSDSDSGSSSCSSGSGCSSGRSSHTHQNFTIRETNFEQGGLKLKIAALKVTKKTATKEPEAKKIASPSSPLLPPPPPPPPLPPTQTPSASSTLPSKPNSKDKMKAEKVASPSPNKTTKSGPPRKVDGRKKTGSTITGEQRGTEKVRGRVHRDKASGRGCLYNVRAGVSPERSQSSPLHSNSDTAEDSDDEEEEEVAEISQQLANELGNIEQENMAISEHLQVINQEDLAAILPDVVSTGNHDEAGAPFDGFEDVSSESGKVAADANGQASSSGSQIQQQNGSQRGSSSNSVTVTGGSAGSNNNAGANGGTSAESGSEVELPEHLVSEAIKRIHIDNEEVPGDKEEVTSSSSVSCKDNVGVNGTSSSRSNGEGGGDGGEGNVGGTSNSNITGSSNAPASTAASNSSGYTSSLLQQFVEKTESLTVKEEPRKRKRGRPPKLAAKIEAASEMCRSGNTAPKCMPELESYMRLDCSVSNVSPDSGIQSVAGSPVHQSCSPSSNPPSHSPAPVLASSPSSTPPPPALYLAEERREVVKRGRGRPPRSSSSNQPKSSAKKGFRERKGSDISCSGCGNKAVTSGADSCDDTPPVPSPVPIAPVKRGPGRPKKAPPVLEPNLPLPPCEHHCKDSEIRQQSNKKSSANAKASEHLIQSCMKHAASEPVSDIKDHKSTILNEIYEKVNRRLEPSNSAPERSDSKKVSSKSPKTKTQKKLDTSPHAKAGIWVEKKKKGRRRNESGSWGEGDSGPDTENGPQFHFPRQRHVSSSAGSPCSSSHQGSIRNISAHVSISRMLRFPPGMVHHKHKRRKKKVKRLKPEKNVLDPSFIQELDRLSQDFKRFCVIAKISASPASTPRSGSGDVNLPSIFRVKRIIKKRKGSEKSQRASDRESGAEGDGGKEKNRQRRPKKNAVEAPKGQERLEASNEQRLPLKKRHYHISTAATSQTASVPQTSQTADSSAPVDFPKKPAERERTTSQEKSDKVSASGVVTALNKNNQAKPADKPVVVSREKSTSNSNSVSAACVGSVSSAQSEIKSKPVVDMPRNSIDEAIEACITRYTATSPPTESSAVVHSVIATPKKRHRLETAAVTANTTSKTVTAPTAKHKENTADAVIPPGSNTKACTVTSPMPNKRTLSRTASMNSGSISATNETTSTDVKPVIAVDICGVSETGEMHTKSKDSDLLVPVSSPSKINSCKSSVSSSKNITQTNKLLASPGKGSTATSKTLVSVSKPNLSGVKNSSPSKSVSANNKVGSSPSKQPSSSSRSLSPNKSLASSPNKPTSVSSSKITAPTSSPVTKAINSLRSPASNKIALGRVSAEVKTTSPKSAHSKALTSIPAAAAVVSVSTVTATTTTATTVVTASTSVTTVVSSISSSMPTVSTASRRESAPTTATKVALGSLKHNLRLKRANGMADKDEISFRRGGGKKKKLIRDVRVHVTKLSPTDYLLKKAVGAVKQRVRRRKAINRTGFPIKKKKKKLPPPQVIGANADSVLDQTSPTPVINVDFKKSVDQDTLCAVKQRDELKSNRSLVRRRRIIKRRLRNKIGHPKAAISKAAAEKTRTAEATEVNVPESKQTISTKRDSVKQSKSRTENPVKTLEEDEEKSETIVNKKEVVEHENMQETEVPVQSSVDAKEPQSSSKQNKGSSLMGISNSQAKLVEPNLLSPAAEPGLPSAASASQAVEASDTDGKPRSKRKRDCSKDESHLPLAVKRSKKCRDEDADPDDSCDVMLPFESLPCSDVPSGDESTKSCRRKKQPRWRKKFLIAGLFSNYYKEDEPRKPSNDVGKPRLVYRPEEHQHGLLPPPYHCGKYLRQRRVEFKLPYDLWWLHTHNQLPGRDQVPSWNYKKIRTNVYYDVKPTYTYEAQACNCVLPSTPGSKGCGEECINRMVYSECSPQLCPCKELCSNQRIQRHEWAPGLEKFMTKDKGWGVKTKYAIKSGEFILEYVGEVVSEKEFKARMATRYIHDTHHYCLNLDGGLVIDGHRMGGDGRFVNHSCEPNCEMQKWSVNGLFRMALFALRDINPHEELSYDYNFSLFNPAEGQPCKCGSAHCRGVIGGKSQRVNGSAPPRVEEKERRMVGRPRKNARKISGATTSVSGSGSSGSVDSTNNTCSNNNSSSNNSTNNNTSNNNNLNANNSNNNSISVSSTVAASAVNNNNNNNSNNINNNNNNNGSISNGNGNCNNNSSCGNKLKYKKGFTEGNNGQRPSHVLPVKPMSHQQRCFAQLHHCFLLRNLEKVKRLRERLKQAARREETLLCNYPRPQVKQSDVFLTQLNALTSPRNIRTRRLAQAEDNPELTKTARLAYVLRDLYNVVATAKDETGELLAAPFINLPSKRKLPQYYQRIQEPIDLATLEQNIVTGFYKTVESFDRDMCRLFNNNVRFFGRTSELGIAATRLRKVYNLAKVDFIAQIEDILGESPPASFIPEHDPGGEEEDVIRCICGLYKDEGMMIQCERCLVWQHCDCVRADEGVEHYLCERCSPRPVDLEIMMDPQPHYATPGLTYYITLLRGDLQLRQGDTVYVLRDMIEESAPKTSPPAKHTYKTIKNFSYSDLDIFRIERLWKDQKGDRFAFGHHYLRPHETYHEPSRKFFPNEVMRVPLYEVVPLDLIMGHCWVLDLNTYCKGRPVGAPEEHVYICEYRVDKSAHLFSKIAKPRHSICTKTYAFDAFDTRLKPQRTYTPHGPVTVRPRGRGASNRAQSQDEEAKQNAAEAQSSSSQQDDDELPLARVRDDALARKRADQKQRLNMILLRLLARLPGKQPLDLSFLLEPGRRHRKKTSILNP